MKVLKWPREVGERGRQSSRGIKRSTCPDGSFKFHKPTFRINNGGREGGGGSNENGQSFRPVQIKYSIRGTWMEDDWIVSTGGKKKRDDWNTREGEEWKREEKVGRLGGRSGCQMALSIPRERLDFASTCEKCDGCGKHLGGSRQKNGWEREGWSSWE